MDFNEIIYGFALPYCDAHSKTKIQYGGWFRNIGTFSKNLSIFFL